MDKQTLADGLKKAREMQVGISKALTKLQAGAFDHVDKRGITPYFYAEGLTAMASAMESSAATLAAIKKADEEFARIDSESQTRTGSNK